MTQQQVASTVRWNIQPFIGGEYRQSKSREYFDNVNPATETTLCEVPTGCIPDIDEAVRIGRQRFDDGCWSRIPPAQRIEVLQKLADLIVQRSSELALLDTLEMGKPISAARHDALSFAPGIIRSCSGFADKLFGSSTPLLSAALAFSTYQPRGVVGAITPWNFPLVNAVIKCVPALAAGNSVVLKPSELAPSSALRFAELALEAGLPAGVLNVVPGLGTTVGAALGSHPDVDLLSFTGSTVTGRKIMELAGRSNGKPVLLECGGKSPQIVFPDVRDLDRVADEIVRSVLWNQGQVCSAHTRLLVHVEIKDALLEKVIARASKYKPGDPLDETTTFGPLASPGQRSRVKAFIDQALQGGACAVLRGTVQESSGCNVSPTIFDGVTPAMPIAREEIFGPVLCVQQFSSDDESIALANATEYGLVATVWTRDSARSVRMAHAIKAGTVFVRTSGREQGDSGEILSREPQKASGFGSELGLKGLEAYSTLKVVSFNGA